MAVSLWIVVLQFHIKQFVTRVGRQRLHVHFLPETTCVSMLRQLLSTKTGFLASLNVILAETLLTLQQTMPQREWVGKSPHEREQQTQLHVHPTFQKIEINGPTIFVLNRWIQQRLSIAEVIGQMIPQSPLT